MPEDDDEFDLEDFVDWVDECRRCRELGDESWNAVTVWFHRANCHHTSHRSLRRAVDWEARHEAMMKERKLAGFGYWKVECFRESLLGKEKSTG